MSAKNFKENKIVQYANIITFNTMINALTGKNSHIFIPSLEERTKKLNRILAIMKKYNFSPDQYTYHNLIYFYGNLGHFEQVNSIYLDFSKNTSCQPGIVFFNTLLYLHSVNPSLSMASPPPFGSSTNPRDLSYFLDEIKKKKISPDIATFNILIQFLGIPPPSLPLLPSFPSFPLPLSPSSLSPSHPSLSVFCSSLHSLFSLPFLSLLSTPTLPPSSSLPSTAFPLTSKALSSFRSSEYSREKQVRLKKQSKRYQNPSSSSPTSRFSSPLTPPYPPYPYPFAFYCMIEIFH